MTRRTFILILVLLVAGALARTSADSLSLTRARELALAQSPTLQKAFASVDASKLEAQLQSYTSLPSIAAFATGTISAPSASFGSSFGGSVGLSVKQTIFDGTNSVLAAIDSLSTSIARANAREEYFNVLNTIDTAYYNAAKASASVDAAKSDLESARANEAVAQAKNQAGMLSPVDLMKQEATVASNEAAFVAAQGTLTVAMRTVSSLTGVAPPITIAPVDTTPADALMKRIAQLDGKEVTEMVDNLSTSAQKNNPSLIAAGLAVEQAQQTIKLAVAGYLPTVSMSLAGSSDFTGSLQGSATVSVSVPLDIWTVGGTVESMKVAAKQTSLSSSETKRTNTLAIEQAVYDTVASAKSVGASQQALDYAERYLQSIQEQYKLSTVSSADLFDAAQLVSTDRSSLISAKYQFLSDISNLRTLAGVVEDDLLVKLIP